MSETTLDHAGPVDLGTYGRHRRGDRPGPRHPFRGRIGTPPRAHAGNLCRPPAFRENVISSPAGETGPWRIPVQPFHADRDRSHHGAAV